MFPLFDEATVAEIPDEFGIEFGIKRTDIGGGMG